MSDQKRSSGGFSGLMGKMSLRSKKDKSPTQSPQEESSQGALPAYGSSQNGSAAATGASEKAQPPGDDSNEYTSNAPTNPLPEVLPSNEPDDAYAGLKDYDIVFLIDDSGSMRGDIPSRWSQVSGTLGDIAEICTKQDDDGIDIYFLNQRDEQRFKNVKEPETVTQIFNSFSPSGLTPTGRRLNNILSPYITACENNHARKIDPPKKLVLIVITDGIATDDPAPILGRIGERLKKIDADDGQLGVQFVQVGDDSGAAASLAKLDDELHKDYHCQDFIDTVPYTARARGGVFNEELVMKILLGAIIKRQDRKVIR